ncbi:hypothetical protein Tlet_0168 [Pseudothermotoga lettingae TMO]|uniref:Uncharacterized protein n=1 Tax=Pseudothermotoga lettingae (strain ATCC BAA-301 / DSM 14385 / NBRC 107922 / TMO) TaxID=416591 RepID=A8F3K4_PSELT|nr:hypothetical protein Tlet_0168 [Pseudothermotoga lettingae TMO]MDI3495596.1 hypothetical protein [Pseudothermotoga sp.]
MIVEKFVLPFFNRKTLPSSDFYSYSMLIFFISNILGLIASIIVVSADYLLALSANRFLGLTQGMSIFSGLSLLFVVIRWSFVIKELRRELIEKIPEYASIAIRSDETLINLGTAVTTAGLVISLFVPFGFLVTLVGLSLAYYFFFNSMKEYENDELIFFSKMPKIAEFSKTKIFNFEVDANVIIYSLITLFGYLTFHQEQYISSVESYVKSRKQLLEEVSV